MEFPPKNMFLIYPKLGVIVYSYCACQLICRPEQCATGRAFGLKIRPKFRWIFGLNIFGIIGWFWSLSRIEIFGRKLQFWPKIDCYTQKLAPPSKNWWRKRNFGRNSQFLAENYLTDKVLVSAKFWHFPNYFFWFRCFSKKSVLVPH